MKTGADTEAPAESDGLLSGRAQKREWNPWEAAGREADSRQTGE